MKNLKLRYKNSVLGFMWSLLTPLLYLAIFSFIFSNAFPDVVNYPLYVLTGLIFWNFYSNATNATINSVINSRGVLKSINVQTIALPISEILATFLNLLLSFIPFSILMYFFDAKIGPETLLVPLVLLMFTIFTLGVGLFVCAFNIYFRDVGILYTTLTPALFYFTPIAYSSSLIPEKFLVIVKLNPLFHFMQMFRNLMYYNEIPHFTSWAIITALTLFSFGIGLYTFVRLEKGFISNY
jgi:ABC-type polysaccharide/polyol phosphate export permease